MGLFNEELYCQICFGNITKEGGYVSEDGRIFGYHHNRKCLEKAAEELEKILPKDKINIKLEYRTGKEVQGDIRNWKKAQEDIRSGKKVQEDIKNILKLIYYHKPKKFFIRK